MCQSFNHEFGTSFLSVLYMCTHLILPNRHDKRNFLMFAHRCGQSVWLVVGANIYLLSRWERGEVEQVKEMRCGHHHYTGVN